ncbi:carbohydrate ABC transporter permease [Halogranum rubrum]|uniref:Binding-protein-dependent transport systems inner membrane component n=1 Tax=Halogranum salarium B-1 TaxID=1210908 RepID=J3JE40_9EURY|nr:sugar ABC transporter permease [Halogranum salarium]EJN58029.1 binding-protein-dependent transport systems inner membrane component [Halogranum salarium B-1]
MATHDSNRETSPTVTDTLRYWRQSLSKALPSTSSGRVAYVFLAPFFVLFGLFLAFPIVFTLYLSFFRFNGVTQETVFWLDLGFHVIELNEMQLAFVGLENYTRLLSDAMFHQAMFNTVFILLLQVPLMVGIALLLAVALDASFVRFKGLFRTMLALPVSANLVAYSTVFLLLMQETGLVNFVLTTLGFQPIPWLSSDFWSRMTIVGAVTWRWTGYNMIILLAGLQNVPQQLYEAAEIDGANRIEKFRYVTIPQLRPVLLFVFVTSTIGTFKLFAEPIIINGGGAPLESTITIVQYIYMTAFIDFNLGYASALTYVLIAVVSVLSIVQIRLGGENDA